MLVAMETSPKAGLELAEHTDPRILRSRQMLQDALGKLLREKEFEEISIQEIAREATLNRATFYLHYADKNALLQAMTEARFKSLLQRRGIVFTCEGAMRATILGVCDYLTETTGCPSQLSRLPLEASIVTVVEGMFLEGFAKHQGTISPAIRLACATTAWAVYGAARRWFQTPDRPPAEEIAVTIEQMVAPILAGLRQTP